MLLAAYGDVGKRADASPCHPRTPYRTSTPLRALKAPGEIEPAGPRWQHGVHWMQWVTSVFCIAVPC
jgi:hypothetical protein